MRLHIHPFSQHARRVLMLCSELGLELETVAVSLETQEQRSGAFLKLNPNGQVPVLEDGDFVLPESHAIMKYLASTSDGARFFPADERARAKVDMWLDWNHTQLNPPVQTIVIQTLFMGENGDKALVAKSQEQALAAIAVLEQSLPFKLGIGGAPSLADLSVASTLALYETSGGGLSDFPATTNWFDEIKARPSFRDTSPEMG